MLTRGGPRPGTQPPRTSTGIVTPQTSKESWNRHTTLYITDASITFSPQTQWKSAQRKRKHCAHGCSKAEPKIFAPPQTPFPGVWDGQNLISWRWSLSLPTNPVWRGSMHAISSYRGNSPTNTPTNPQTGPITIHCAAASLARSFGSPKASKSELFGDF